MKLPYHNLLPDHRNFRNHNPYRKTEIWTPLRSVILLKLRPNHIKGHMQDTQNAYFSW